MPKLFRFIFSLNNFVVELARLSALVGLLKLHCFLSLIKPLILPSTHMAASFFRTKVNKLLLHIEFNFNLIILGEIKANSERGQTILTLKSGYSQR